MRRAALAALLAVGLAGCSSSEKDQRQKTKAASWVASVRSAAAAWDRHELSTVFVRDLIDVAREELGKLQEDLDPASRAVAREAIDALAPVSDALARRDEDAVRAAAASLQRLETALRGGT